jgi:hypothetical protein
LVNGDFSQALSGWTVSDPQFVTVNADNQAVLAENPGEQEVYLYQDFVIPTGSRILTFLLDGMTFDDLPALDAAPDAFGVALLNPLTLTPLAARVDAFTDAFFIGDLAPNAPGESSADLTITAGPAPGSLRFTLDVEDFGGLPVRLFFRLLGGSDPSRIGGSVTLSNVLVSAITDPVVTDFTGTTTVEEGGLATLAVHFTDANPLDAHDVTIDWGDGTQQQLALTAGVFDFALEHRYADNGTYLVTVTLTDALGGTDSASLEISVANAAPTASAAATGSGFENAPVTLTGTFGDAGTADTHTFLWHVVASNGQVVPDGTGQDFSFIPLDDGTYTITFHVTDDDSGVGTASVVVTIENVAPNASFANGGSAQEGSTGSVSFSGGFDQSPVDTAEGFLYSYDFDNDGSFEITDSLSSTALVPASFLDDGPGTRTVRGRIADRDGGFTDYLTGLTIDPVAPTATLALDATVNEGGTATASFTNPFDPSAADTAAGFRYSFDFDNDGTFEILDSSSPSAAVPAGFLADGPGLRTIRARIADEDGAATDYTATITVLNVAPTATLSPGGTAAEGSAGSVSFGNVFDPSPADLAAGLRYSFDFDNDGVFEITDSTSAFAVVPASYLDDGPASRVIRGRIADKDGGFTDYTTTIAIANVVPTASLTGATGGVRGQGRSFLLSAFDPSVTDRAAGFTFQINWGDGTTQTVLPGEPLNLSHAFRSNGTYVIQVTARDKDGGVSAAVTHTINITAVALQPDPCDPTKMALVVGGTESSDNITITPNGCEGGIRVILNCVSLGTFSPTGRILVFAQGGNDDVQVSGSIGRTVEAYGGLGCDRLRGGAGDDVLLGGDGDDLIIGGNGRDLLIGGIGRDRLVGNADDDILIAGTTAYDADCEALCAVMEEWTRCDANYTTRVNHLRQGTGLNGSIVLTDATVFDDGVEDILTGSSGADWFLINTDPAGRDRVTDRHAHEFVSDIDFIDGDC